MKRSCLIFLELAILWSKVYSSSKWVRPDSNELPLPDSNGNAPWAVTVKAYRGRSWDEKLFGNQTESVREAFENVLCAGVIIDVRFFFVPGICVDGIEAKELVVIHPSSGYTHPVTKIEFWGVHYNVEYAIVFFRRPIRNVQPVPIIGPSDVAHPFNCYVSGFWNEHNVPWKGKFDRVYNNKCNYDGMFEGSVSVSATEGTKMLYASPLVCEEQDAKQLMLVGYYAWGFPLENVSEYMCFTDKASLTNSPYTVTHGIDKSYTKSLFTYPKLQINEGKKKYEQAICPASRLRMYCADD